MNQVPLKTGETITRDPVGRGESTLAFECGNQGVQSMQQRIYPWLTGDWLMKAPVGGKVEGIKLDMDIDVDMDLIPNVEA